MRILPRGLRPLLFLTALLPVHAADTAPPKITVPNVFSYQMPLGWVAIDPQGGSAYPTAVEGPDTAGPGHLKALISVNTDSAPMNLTEWCTKALAHRQADFAELHARLGELQPFKTAASVPGYTATVDLTARGRPIHYVMYFFAGAGNTKITVTCACAATDVDHYGPLFEAAMETFVPY
jgi:hypothetical protein